MLNLAISTNAPSLHNRNLYSYCQAILNIWDSSNQFWLGSRQDIGRNFLCERNQIDFFSTKLRECGKEMNRSKP